MEPPSLPQQILGESPSVKFLYIWLRSQGVVSYSVRQIAEATGLSDKPVSTGLNRLRELGLLEDVGEARERVKPTFRAR
jgi:DNA-binding transcriptional regulator GbsR (MarR family)